MPRTEDRTPVLGLKFTRWRENASVQQLVCCLASGCLLATGRMMQDKGHPFDPELGRQFEVWAMAITNTCGKHKVRMSAGVQRSILSGIQTIIDILPGPETTLVSEMSNRSVRIMGAATWPLIDDAARLCTAWVPKAKGVWQEVRESLWAWVERECRQFPAVGDEAWLLTEKVIGSAGYYI